MLYHLNVSKSNLPDRYRSTESASFLMAMIKQIKTIQEKKNGLATPENIREKIGILAFGECSFLCKCFDSPESSAFASSASEGRFAAALHQKGIIEPNGKFGNHISWRPVDDLFHKDERELVRRIANWKGAL